MQKNVRHHRQKGEGESKLIFTLLFVAIAVSLVYFGVKFVLKIKEERKHLKETQEIQAPAPKSMEDVGGYDVTVRPIL